MQTSHVSFHAIGFYVITLSMMVLLFGLSIRLGTYTLSFEEIQTTGKKQAEKCGQNKERK